MKKVLFLFLILFLVFAVTEIVSEKKPIEATEVAKEDLKAKPTYLYDIQVDSFQVIHGEVKKDQTLGMLLFSYHINHTEIHQIVKKSKEIDFDVRDINAGNKYTLICSRDSLDRAMYFIYEEDKINYIVLAFNDEISVERKQKKVITVTKKSSGNINSSLWLAISEQGLSDKIAIELSNIYAWTIDFFKIQKGDHFKIYYENNYIDSICSENYIGIGRILACEFTHNNIPLYSFYYKPNDATYGEYFDEKGKTLRKAFLMAPVDYKRISSRFSANRKHPVTGQWKGHFGTDYAAPRGTPIWSTANGTVIIASYTKNNGNYVKIRHNATYSTQYLHMSKIEKGIKKGKIVKQGEIIGYVGSTGLATGPHVCYRFWKNGRQVDPFKQSLPPGDPIKKENFTEYMIIKDSLLNILVNEADY